MRARLTLTVKGVLFAFGLIAAVVGTLAYLVDGKLHEQIRAFVVETQAQSVRTAAVVFAETLPGFEVTLDRAGAVTRIEAQALPASVDTHDVVDRIALLTGETATLFRWDADARDFRRVTTNIRKPDGSRAVGTLLGRTGAVFDVVRRGETFRGEAEILGTDYHTIYQPVFDEAGSVIGIVYAGVERSRFAAMMEEIYAGVHQAAWLTLIGGCLLASLALRTVIRPLTRLVGTVRRIAADDTDVDVPSRARGDEIGDLARAVDVLKENQFRARGARAEARLETLRALVDVSISGNEVMALMAKLRRDVGSSANEVQTMATAVEEMRASLSEIAGTSETANTSATACRDDAQRGAEHAAAATDAMCGIAAGVGQVRGTVDRLSDASAQIETIVGQIQDIAAQTNLLALNATIEAARAGDAGRGFAVVAGEVKALADQTARATDDIRDRIKAVVDSIAEIHQAMEASRSSVENGRGTVDEVAGGLGSIAERVSSMTNDMSQLAAAITEQSAATDEIARSASGVARSSEVCNEEIGGAIGAIASLSDTLNAQMATFADLGDEALVRMAQNDHMIFKKTILDVVVGQSHLRTDAVSTHTTCRLGKWAADVSPTVRALPTFARLEAPHRRVHELGREIVALVHDGRRDEAIGRFDELDAASADVIAVLRELADELRSDREAA